MPVQTATPVQTAIPVQTTTQLQTVTPIQAIKPTQRPHKFKQNGNGNAHEHEKANYPPPRLARTAFLRFRRQAPLYHLLTYTLVPPYTVLCTLLRDQNPAAVYAPPTPPTPPPQDLTESLKNQYFQTLRL